MVSLYTTPILPSKSRPESIGQTEQGGYSDGMPLADFYARSLAVPALPRPPSSTNIGALAAPDSRLQPLITQSLAVHAGRGDHLGAIIGHNQFDVYALARWARARGQNPRPLLAHIELSRAFTCHQLHRRIVTLDAQPRVDWAALYVLGLLETFYDEDVKVYEATRLLNESLYHLKSIAAKGLPVLITISAPKEPGREHFLELVARAVAVYALPAPDAPQLPAATQLQLGM